MVAYFLEPSFWAVENLKLDLGLNNGKQPTERLST